MTSKTYSRFDSASLQSKTIDLLRFPLAIAVIFIHCNPEVINLLDADFPLLSAHGIYNVTGIAISHVTTHIAVPTFFLISGLLFFLNFQEWKWEGYKKKMSSRLRTLVIPYFLWNLVTFLILIAVKLAAVFIKGKPMSGVYQYISDNSWHIFYDCNVWGTERVNWLGGHLQMTGPFDLPLWFLRDLIVVTLLTPVVYYFVKKTKLIGLFVLFLAYVSRIWTLVPGFHITAFFYFTLGAYLAINRKSLVVLAERIRFFTIPLSCALACFCITYDGLSTVAGQNLMPFFVCSTVFCAIYAAGLCITSFHFAPNKSLVASCFFVYAFHAAPFIGPLGYIRNLLRHIIPGTSYVEEIICYLIAPFLTAFVCYLVFVLLKRYFPKVAPLFTGNR